MRDILRAVVLASVLLVGWTALAHAQMPACPSQGTGFAPVGFESITVSTVAIGLTPSLVTDTKAAAAYVTLETGNGSLRWLTFGIPTAAVGHLIDPPGSGNAGSGAGTWLCGRETLLGLRMIRAAAADAILRVSYYRQR